MMTRARWNGRGSARAILREPLLHFAVAAGLLFAVHAGVARDDRDVRATRRVHIAAADVQWLVDGWTRQWQREPTRDELAGQVRELLREEILAREAMELGLDQDDTIVRRRLAQKVEFLVQDTMRLAEPSDGDLARFYAANPDRFTEPARISFAQIPFSRDRRHDADADARAALAALEDGSAHPADVGDALLIDTELHDADVQRIEAELGPDFAHAVFGIAPGQWHGPIASPYGVHLVRVLDVQPAHRRDLAQVRDQVRARWRDERQREGEAQYFARLLEKYDVVVDDSVTALVGPLNAPRS